MSMRRIIIAVSASVVALVIVVLVLPFLVDVNHFRPILEQEARRRLGRPVKLGQMHLKLLPIAFRADHASVGEDPRFGQGQFAQMHDLDIHLGFWPLIRNSAGLWNFASLGHPSESTPQAKPAGRKTKPEVVAPQESPQPSSGIEFSFDYLSIVDGTVALTDNQKRQPRAVYDHIDLKVSSFVPGQPLTVSAGVHLPGEGRQEVRLDGKVGPIQEQTILDTAVDAKVDLNDVRLSGLKKFLNAEMLEGTDFVISGHTSVKNQNHTLASDGQITLKDLRVKGTDVGQKISADYKFSDNLTSDLLTIGKGDLRFGAMPLSVTGTANLRPSPSLLDVRLQTSNASIEELARLASKFGLRLDPGVKVNGDLSGDVRAKGPSDKPTIEGMVSGRHIGISGGPVLQPVDVTDVNLTITTQSIESNNFTARSGKNDLAARFTLAGYTTANQSIDASLKATHADIAELLNLAKKYGVTAVKDLTGSGTLSLDLRIQGPLKNASALTFSGSSDIQEAALKTPSLAQPVRVTNAKLVFTPQSLESNDFSATVGNLPLSVQFAVAAYSSANPQIKAAVRSTQADVAALINTARAFGVNGLEGVMGTGSMSFDVRANGALNKGSALTFTGSSEIQDATLKTASLAKPVRVTGAKVALNPQTVQSNEFSASTGNLGFAVQFTLTSYATATPKINLAVRSTRAELGELLNTARAFGVKGLEGMNGSGAIAFAVRANGPLKDTSALTFSGSGHLSDVTVSTPSIAKPVKVQTADVKVTSDSITLDKIAANVDQTNASGMLSMRNLAAPVVQFTLKLDKVSVAELQQLTTPGTPPKTRAQNSTFSLLPRLYAETSSTTQPGVLEKTTGNGTVTVGTLIYDQLLLNNVKANVALDRGVIKLAPVTAQVYGGQQSGAITIDTRQRPTAVSVTTTFQKVDANQLLSSTSSLKDVLYGVLGANGGMSFQLASANDIARSLSGKLSLNLANGKLAHVDFLNQLAAVGRLVQSGGGDAEQTFTNLVKLTGAFDINNGIAQTNNLQAVIDGGTLAAQGTANLADQSLNMHVTAVLTKSMSEKVGGTTIGGYMSTALANANGELVIPVVVTGTLQKPQVAPDLKKIAEMKLRNIVPTGSNPAQATAGILGQVMGNKEQKGGVGGTVAQILGTLGGQQQTRQPNQPGRDQSVASPQEPQQPQPQQQVEPAAQSQEQQAEQKPPPKKKKGALDVLNDILKQQQEQQKKQPSPPPK